MDFKSATAHCVKCGSPIPIAVFNKNGGYCYNCIKELRENERCRVIDPKTR